MLRSPQLGRRQDFRVLQCKGLSFADSSQFRNKGAQLLHAMKVLPLASRVTKEENGMPGPA
jgi:hypothetical protein